VIRIAALAVALCPALALAQASFQGLGLLPGAPAGGAIAVSADGSVVAGGNGTIGNYQRIFRWTAAGGLQEVPPPPGATGATVAGMSLDGQFIVGAAAGLGYRWSQAAGHEIITPPPGVTSLAVTLVSGDGGTVSGLANGARYRWTASTGMVVHPNLDERVPTTATISDDGSIMAGTLANRSPYRIWSIGPGGFSTLPDLGGPLGSLGGVVAPNGHVLGVSYTVPGRPIAVRWANGAAPTPLIDDSFWSAPRFTSADGTRFVATTGMSTWVHFDGGSLQDITAPAGSSGFSTIRGISGDGQRVWGTMSRVGIGTQPYLWTRSGGAVWLLDALTAGGANVTGWTSFVMGPMSRDGTTWVGEAVGPQSVRQPFRAVLPR
jgi:uncharacterized membrane protein